MRTTIIAAIAADYAIGRAGDLAFHISADLRRFKSLTSGHTVIMGRKTFASLPKGALPNRRNIILTHDTSTNFPGAETATSLESAIAMARDAGETEAFIIGGAQVYAQALPLADCLQITVIQAVAPGADAFFPKISPIRWQTVEESPFFTDEKTGIPYRFQTLLPR